ncbi:MAG TPA: GNAT family N-acetyltransferase [Phototrophicaceae bacterium]|nr:GNAT family N-acetyltransferase [Phototrophicaceae bacterium]
MSAQIADCTTLEAYAARAWPSLETEVYDHWQLRFANGYTNRANTVLPLSGSTLDLNAKIAYCEAFYQQRGIAPGFKLMPAACPPNLDAELERRGYTRHSESRVMVADLTQAKLPEPPPGITVQLATEFSESWLDIFCQFNPTHIKHRATMPLLLANITGQRYFSTVRQNGAVVAVGLGVQEGAYVGLFDIVVREDRRQQGLGRTLVASLLRRARTDGATVGYLQVVAQNAPAIRLYSQFGYQEVYPYWYRTRSE